MTHVIIRNGALVSGTNPVPGSSLAITAAARDASPEAALCRTARSRLADGLCGAPASAAVLALDAPLNALTASPITCSRSQSASRPIAAITEVEGIPGCADRET